MKKSTQNNKYGENMLKSGKIYKFFLDNHVYI